MEQQNYTEAATCAVQKKPLTDKAFSRFFVSSLIALLVAIAALCSSTYAWYATTVATPSNTLIAAYYDITVTVDDAGTVLDAETDGSFTLQAGKSYTVTLQKSALATAENGYAKILCDGISYTTEQINSGTLVITIAPSADASVLFVPCIGTNTATEKIANGDTLALNS